MLFSLISNGAPCPVEAPENDVPWWSFTKTVLAAAALSLVRDGLVGLDTQLPEGPFTLRQLLRHDAGLADYGELADYHSAVADKTAPWPADDMLQRLDASTLRYTPGAGWRYSNVGYLYVVKLLERLTGLTLNEVLRERVFNPLSLPGARLARTPADLQHVCGTQRHYDPGWVYHGLLVGPLTEAALLLDRLLAGQLLPVTWVKEMQTARVLGGPIPGRPWVAPGYGLGLMQGPVANGLILSGHTGCGPGSVIAVYSSVAGDASATCAVFHAGADDGAVEAQAVAHLSVVLGG